MDKPHADMKVASIRTAVVEAVFHRQNSDTGVVVVVVVEEVAVQGTIVLSQVPVDHTEGAEAGCHMLDNYVLGPAVAGNELTVNTAEATAHLLVCERSYVDLVSTDSHSIAIAVEAVKVVANYNFVAETIDLVEDPDVRNLPSAV